MIPILYSGDETAFTSNGLGRLADCTSCTVTEERNGIYECEFKLPVTSPMYAVIEEGMILGVTHDDQGDVQPFDIYARSAPLDGLVTFYARHISYRLRNIILRPYTASSCAEALAAMPANSYNRNPFTFWTSKATAGQWAVTVPSACKAVLMGQQGSILDVYGTGEYEWDKWTVKLHTHRGADNGVSIRYGYNLADLTQSIDDGDSYSAVAPFWKAAEGDQVVTLPEGIVVSGNAPMALYPWTIESGEEITTESGEPIEFQIPKIIPVPMDLSQDFETQPTPEQLRQRALQRLNSSEAWLPSNNIKVKFVDLAHTEDYKDVAALQRVSLCDYVNVYCGPLGVSAVSMKVIRTVFNVLAEIYDEVELGSPKPTYADTIMAEVDGKIDDLEKRVVSVDVLQSAVANATAQITGANGGYIRDIYNANGDRIEMLVMDTLDIATATKVWRWNLGGLGFSSNGYAGPYTTAITQDGHIVADFVDVGTLNANIIGAHTIAVDKLTGSISGGLGNTWGIDFLTGTLTIGNISAANVTTGTLSADRIAANSIAVSKLTGTISNSGWELNLTNGTFTIGNISANNINAGTLSVDRIAANSIGVQKLTGEISGGNGWTINLTAGTLTIGNISASNITTGTMSAERIQGGTLKLGGTNGQYGKLWVYNADGVLAGYWDKDGISLTEGRITSSDGKYWWNLTDGTMNTGGHFTSTATDAYDNIIKTEINNGMIICSKNTTRGIEIGYNETFEFFSIEAAQSNVLSIAAQTYDGPEIRGGSSITLNKNGSISLRFDSMLINGATTPANGTYILAGGSVIEVYHGIVTSIY